MKRNLKKSYREARGSEKGFTLIEVIVGLIIFGIMGTMLVTMGQTALTKSGELVGLTRNTYNLKAVMENINSDYISMVNPSSSSVLSLDELVSHLNTSGFYHSSYAYTVVSMTRFADFVPGTGNSLVPGNVSATGDIMRVIISDPSGMRLAALFFEKDT